MQKAARLACSGITHTMGMELELRLELRLEMELLLAAFAANDPWTSGNVGEALAP